MRRRGPACLLLWIALALAAQPAPELAVTAEPHHHLALQNAYVRVCKVEVPPHEATLMHRHDYDYIYVTLGSARVENDVQGKAPVTLALQDGETRFRPGKFAHVVRNLSDQPFRNVSIELLRSRQAGRGGRHKWKEERGLEVLNGGTQDILFVKDGARVSDVQLQPGGVLPKHRHAGPHLVVAVTDLDLRSEVEGGGSAVRQLQAGDIAWVKGGFTHTLTNVGTKDARFVAVEFQ